MDRDGALALLACPVCRQGLVADGRAVRCGKAHAFDWAREGYLNLKVQGKAHGDSRDMLAARERFLAAGHYQGLVEALVETVCCRLGPARPALLDVGCGTGHYLGAVLQRLPAAEAVGLDASRDAVRLAAKRLPSCLCVVADTWQPLPLTSEGFDAILNVFAPRNPVEFARVLKPGGWLLAVIPGELHLAELRSVLPMLNLQEDKESRVLAALATGFELAGREALTAPLALSREDVRDLLLMSPSGHRAERLGWPAAVDQLTERVAVTGSFVLLTFRPR